MFSVVCAGKKERFSLKLNYRMMNYCRILVRDQDKLYFPFRQFYCHHCAKYVTIKMSTNLSHLFVIIKLIILFKGVNICRNILE